jgi:hypothetical protein
VKSAGIGGGAGGQVEPEEAKQPHSGERLVLATAQMAQAVQAFDGQSQDQQKPANEQAIGMMVGHVLEAITILRIVEALVFDFPPSLGHSIQAFWADPVNGEVGQPIGFDHSAIGL